MWRQGAKETPEQFKPTINTYKKYSKIHLRTMDKAHYKPIPINKWDIGERSAKDQLICMSSTMENKMSSKPGVWVVSVFDRLKLKADFQVQQLFSQKVFYKIKKALK